MYKLTNYETDDDLDGDNVGGDLSKKSEKETIIYDKSDPIYAKPWAHRSKDKKRIAGVIETDGKDDSNKSTQSGRKIFRQEMDRKFEKRAYPVHPHSPKNMSKSRISRFCGKGCPIFLLLIYLMLLTAAVLALFILIKQLKDENIALKRFYLQEKTASHRPLSDGSTNDPKPQALLKGFQDQFLDRNQNQNANSCCISSWKTLWDFRAKFTRTSDQLGSLQKVCHEKLSFATERITELENAVESLRDEIKATKDKPQYTNQNQPQKEKKSQITNNETPAFRFIRAAEDTIENIFNKPSDAINGNYRTLRYVEEEIISKYQDQDPSSGVFTVPVEGTYLFFISFCTFNEKLGVELALMRNEEEIRLFRVPILSSNSSAFLKTSQDPSFPIPLSTAPIVNHDANTVRHHYSVIFYLEKGDQIKILLKNGAIVELAAQNGLESEFCTEFSGVKL